MVNPDPTATMLSWIFDKMETGKEYKITPDQLYRIKDNWEFIHGIQDEIELKFNDNCSKLKKVKI